MVAATGDLDVLSAVPLRNGDAFSLRWMLLPPVEETARHAGHADIIRESIDGATAYPLMAAVEDWPETPWMKPWRPTA